MYIPKRYGQSQITTCPFCDKQAIAKNAQQLPVCKYHLKSVLPDMKCACSSYLELRTGKWGPYYNCIKCGNIPFNRGLEVANKTN